jgi:hypothetical protein
MQGRLLTRERLPRQHTTRSESPQLTPCGANTVLPLPRASCSAISNSAARVRRPAPRQSGARKGQRSRHGPLSGLVTPQEPPAGCWRCLRRLRPSPRPQRNGCAGGQGTGASAPKFGTKRRCPLSTSLGCIITRRSGEPRPPHGRGRGPARDAHQNDRRRRGDARRSADSDRSGRSLCTIALSDRADQACELCARETPGYAGPIDVDADEYEFIKTELDRTETGVIRFAGGSEMWRQLA